MLRRVGGQTHSRESDVYPAKMGFPPRNSALPTMFRVPIASWRRIPAPSAPALFVRSVSSRSAPSVSATRTRTRFLVHSLSRRYGGAVQVYLDYQAATPVRAEVKRAMEPFLAERFGNASSLHRHGKDAREAIAGAREKFARLVNAEDGDSIIFTGGGTEAVNLAVKGAFFGAQRRGRTHIVLNAVEHPAVSRSVEFLKSLGATATEVPVDDKGFVDPVVLREAIRDDTCLVCIHHANHDIGTIQRVEEIGEIAGERGVPLFVDAVASAGWLELDARRWNAGLIALSPHRFYGPKGVGVLYRSKRARILPLIHGGEQEEGRRAGTENVAGIAGAGVAAELAIAEQPQRANLAHRFQKRIWNDLSSSIRDIHLNGPSPGAERHPGNLNISVRGVEGEGLCLALDLRGVAIASGAACVTKSMRVPPVLAAIGQSEELAKGNVLISPGQETTDAEVDFFLEQFRKTVGALREMSPSWEE